jgi:hypothetical protein
MAFANLYPLETFADVADAAWWRSNDFNGQATAQNQTAMKAANDLDQRDRKRIEAHKVIFLAAVAQQLDDLLSQKRLGAATGLAGRELPLVSAWNALVTGEEGDYTRKWLLDGLASIWTKAFLRMDKDRYSRRQSPDYVPGKHRLPSKEQQIATWESICAALDEGTSSDDTFGWGIRMTDAKTGDLCVLQFENWTAKLMVYDDSHELVPAQDVAEIELVTAEFDVPTGKLILTDALRVEGFVQATDFDDDREYKTLSLNTEVGQTARISAHANEHQIAYTQTSNTCVAVFQSADKSALMVTEAYAQDDFPADENDHPIIPGWNFIGTFSCDVWRVFAFDRATAISLMAKSGCTNPEQELDRYLSMVDADVADDDRKGHHEKSYAGNIVHVDVAPGRWSIHAGSDFASRVDYDAHNIPQGIEPWCILKHVA